MERVNTSGTFVLLILIVWPVVMSANTCVANKPVKILGALCGRVFDPTGAVVPNVQLRVLDEAGGMISDASVDARGDFLFARLAKGKYRLTTSRPWVISFGDFEITKPDATGCTHPVSVSLGIMSCEGGLSKKRPPHY
jgi:hypothetical protein